MKKVLMLCFLLVALTGASQAIAAPFEFGSNFDDSKSLIYNLQNNMPTDKSSVKFASVGNRVIAGSTELLYVKVLGLSDAMITNSNYFKLTVNDGADVIADARDLATHWNTVGDAYSIGAFGAYLSTDISLGKGGLIDAILFGAPHINVVATGAYSVDDDVIYTPADGYGSINIMGGTYFVGLSFTGDVNKTDVILALSIAPMHQTPVPAAVWLLGSGLAGIIAVRKRMA